MGQAEVNKYINSIQDKNDKFSLNNKIKSMEEQL